MQRVYYIRLHKCILQHFQGSYHIRSDTQMQVCISVQTGQLFGFPQGLDIPKFYENNKIVHIAYEKPDFLVLYWLLLDK